MICDRLGIDVREVIEAAGTRPQGFMRFLPGPGLGGHCISIETMFLAWRMKTRDYRTRFIDPAAEVNAELPEYGVRRAAEALNSARKPVEGSRVLILGVAYKPDVSDTRERSALNMIALLRQQGAEVEYHDQDVASLQVDSDNLSSVDLTPERLEATDPVLIATGHSAVDYGMVGRHAELVVSPRNAMRSAGKAIVYPMAGLPRNGSYKSIG